MKITSNYSYRPNNVAFGDNKGFFEAIDNLKKDLNVTYHEDLMAHAKNLQKDDAFWKKVNLVLKDEKIPPVLKKMINWAIEGK